MSAFSPFTWLVLILSWGSFFLGLWVLEILATEKFPPKTNSPSLESNPFANYRWDLHLLFTSIFFSICIVSFAFTYFNLGSTVLFSGKAGELMHSKDHYQGPLYFVFFQSGAIAPIGLFLLGTFKRWNTNKKLRILSILLFAISFYITFLFIPTRGFLFQVLSFTVALFVINGFQIRIWQVIIIPFVAIALFLMIAYFQDGFDPVKIILPYQYIANNFWNLDHALTLALAGKTTTPTFGLTSTFGIGAFIPQYLAVPESLGLDVMYNEQILKVKGLNSVSFQWHLYKDFGIFSVIFGSFFLGILNAWMWKILLYKPTPVIIGLYSCSVFYLLQSSFGGLWILPNTIFWFTTTFIIIQLCNNQPKLQSTTPQT